MVVFWECCFFLPHHDSTSSRSAGHRAGRAEPAGGALPNGAAGRAAGAPAAGASHCYIHIPTMHGIGQWLSMVKDIKD